MVRAIHKVKLLAAATGLLLCIGCHDSPKPDPMEGTTRGEVVGGYVVHPSKSKELQEKQQREIAHKQEEDLDQQQKEIEDLKRQQYQDERLKEYLDRTQAASQGRNITPDEAAPPPPSAPAPATSAPNY